MEPGAISEARLLGTEVILASRDVPSTVAYYRDVLGFEGAWLWGDPPTHGGIRLDEAAFQFTLDPGLAARVEGQQIFVRARGIEEWQERHRANGAEIVAPLEAMPWGMREYTVRDPSGYRLRFAEAGGETGRSRPLPPFIQIEARVPSWPEMQALNRAVGWAEVTNPDTARLVPDVAVFGTVAVDGNTGAVVGCAVVTTDGAGFYYIRDVMVHPDYQRQHIGDALMRPVAAYLEAHAPDHALAALLTGESLAPFYARFGFTDSLHGMNRVLRHSDL